MSLPRWLDPLLDAEQMRATDRGRSRRAASRRWTSWSTRGRGSPTRSPRHAPGGRVAVVCGKGNNGGDGLVAARLLRQAGRQVDVLLVWPAEWLQGDAKEMLKPARGARSRSRSTRRRLKGVHVIVDALLGTGFEGAPREPADAVIAAVNAAKARVVAADVPSGVNASTGEVEGEAVRAHRHGDLPPRQARAVDRARQGPRGDGRRDRHRHPARRPGEGRGGADQRRRAARDAAARRGLDEVLLGQRVHPRRRERAHRRAVDGRAGRDARRGGLRDGRRAREPRAVVHGEAARGDDGRAARDATAR